MKAKNLFTVLGTVIVIAIIAFLVLSGKTITVGGGAAKVDNKTITTVPTTTAPATTKAGTTTPTTSTPAPTTVGTATSTETPATTTVPVAKPELAPKSAEVNTQTVDIPAATTKTASTEAQTATATTTAAPATTATPAAKTTAPATTSTPAVATTATKPLFTIPNPFSHQNINLGLDLKGGVSIVYQANATNPSKADMDSAVELLRNRLNVKGYTEAEVSLQGTNRIRVEIPGIGDPNKAVNEIGRTAELKFYGITTEQLAAIQKDAQGLVDSMGAQASPLQKEQIRQYGIVQGIQSKGELVLRGKDIDYASKDYEQASQVSPMDPVVKLQMTAEGTQKFSSATTKYKDNIIAIMLDNDILSMPRVSTAIDSGSAVINGMSSIKEAESLAALINSGSLPFELKDIQRTAIEARLGQDALQGSVLAGLIGSVLVLLFMILMYRFPGFVADIALVGYIFIVLSVYALFNVTLTLPGIAGMILSIGMAVDANVIIFSRIKEELRADKSTKSAIQIGFHKAMNAITDGNASAFIIAVILYWQGTGPIKGFGQTLMIGILVSLFTAIVVTRLLLNSMVELGAKNPVLYGGSRKPKLVADLSSKK